MTMVAIGAIAAAMAFILDLFGETEKNVAKDTQIASYRNFTESVKEALFTGEDCTKMLNLPIDNFTAGFVTPTPADDLNLPAANFAIPNLSNWGQSVVLNYNYGKKIGPIKFEADPNNRWKIGSLSIYDVRLKVYSGTIIRQNIQFDAPNSPKLIAARGLLAIIPEEPKIPLQNKNYSDLTIDVMVYYTSGANPRLVGCFQPEGAAEFCVKEGGAYNPDPTLTTDRRCQPDLYCRVHSSGVRNTSTGCPAPYQPYQVGSGRFMCQWCNTNKL